MATLAALSADVYSITNRSDLVTQTDLAVKVATLKAHQIDYFQRDIVTGSFTFADPSLYVQTFNRATLTRWRAWSYLRNYNPVAAPSAVFNGKEFDIITPNNLFDAYNTIKQNIAWDIGNSTNLRSNLALPVLYYGFYQNQNITDINDMGWISDAHPYAIVFEAARNIFKQIGWDQEAVEYGKLVAEQYGMVKLSNITTLGM